MAETLLAILLVTSTAEESTISFRWPPYPKPSSFDDQPAPVVHGIGHTDAPTHSISNGQLSPPVTSPNLPSKPELEAHHLQDDGEDFDGEWSRPGLSRTRIHHPEHSLSPEARQASLSPGPPAHDFLRSNDEEEDRTPEYDELLGFSRRQLARMLTPHKRSLFQTRFELAVDDLVFIGHPICIEDEDSSVSAGGGSMERLEDAMSTTFRPRGRTTSTNTASTAEEEMANKKTSDAASYSPKLLSLNSFSIVLVLDNPDFSSACFGDLSKYFDQIYHQISVPVMAQVSQQQTLHNLVEKESNILGDLEEDCINNGDSYEAFAAIALKKASCARAMENIYSSIKGRSLARVQFGADSPSFEVQLPPHLDDLLYSGCDRAYGEQGHEKAEDDSVPCGPQLELGGELPALTPWKSLFVLDEEINEAATQKSLEDAGFTPHDLALFLQASSITRNLRDMAEKLGWSLDSRVYPTVRWLVFHRRVRVVDAVDAGLETVFCVSDNCLTPLLQLSNEFVETFRGQIDLSLPEIVAGLTTRQENGATIVASRQTFHTLFVKMDEYIPLWLEVVTWMMKRDLVQPLYLRVRIVISAVMKQKVYDEALAGRPSRLEKPVDSIDEAFLQEALKESKMNKAADHSPALPNIHASDSPPARTSSLSIMPEEFDRVDEEILRSKDELRVPSILYDPSRAGGVEKRWLEALSCGKENVVAEIFERVSPFFDGKKTAEEIMFVTGVSRGELEWVLRHYEHNVST